MGKHLKLPASSPTPTAPRPRKPAAPSADVPAPASESEPFEAASLLDRTSAHVEKLVVAAEAALASGHATPALMRESSGLARAVATLDSARLAREKARRALVKKLSRALVLEYIRELEPIERSNLIADVHAMNDGGSVLA